MCFGLNYFQIDFLLQLIIGMIVLNEKKTKITGKKACTVKCECPTLYT